MRILLQHVRNRLYFRRKGVWTSNLQAAYDFGDSEHAIEFAHNQNLNEVQLAVKFGDAHCDKVVPLPRRDLPSSTS